jgi:hypothetical protein
MVPAGTELIIRLYGLIHPPSGFTFDNIFVMLDTDSNPLTIEQSFSIIDQGPVVATDTVPSLKIDYFPY